MKCIQCGRENKDGAKFCVGCGASLIQTDLEQDSVQSKRSAKNGSKKVFILLIVVVVLIAAAVAVYFALDMRKEKQYQNRVDTGLAYLEEQSYEEAVEEFTEAIAIDPKQIKPYRGLAEAYDALDETDLAEETYETAIVVVAEEYADNGKLPDEAKELYEDAINHYGENDNIEKVEELADEIIAMLDDEDEVDEINDLQDYYGRYWAYYNKIMELQEKYGDGNKTEAYVDFPDKKTYLWGLCFAKLIDFNADGYEELIVAYLEDKDEYQNSIVGEDYVIEVWAYQDFACQKVFEGTIYIPHEGYTDEGFYIASLDEKYYVVQGYDFITFNFWGYNGKEFEQEKSLEGDWIYEDYYAVDGKEVTEVEYQTEYDKWMENAQMYLLEGFKGGSLEDNAQDLEETLQELDNTIKLLCEKLRIPYETEESDDADAEDRTEETSQSVMGKEDFAEISGENVLDYEVWDYDGDGKEEAFGITGSKLDESFLCDKVNIYYISSDNEITKLESDTYGFFNGIIQMENGQSFLLWEVSAEGSGSVTIICGVKEGQAYEPDISKNYMLFQECDEGYIGYVSDFSKGYHDWIEHYFKFNEENGQFEEV